MWTGFEIFVMRYLFVDSKTNSPRTRIQAQNIGNQNTHTHTLL